MNFSFHLNSLIINVVESWMNEWNENIPKWFFIFSKNIFPVPKSTKESAKKRKVMGFEPWIMAHSDPSWLKSRTKEPQKQFRPLPNQTEPNFFLLVRHFYYSNAVNFRWLRWLIIVMNDLILFLMHCKDLVVSIDDLRENFIKARDSRTSSSSNSISRTTIIKSPVSDPSVNFWL